MKNTAKTLLERLAWQHIASARKAKKRKAIRPAIKPNLSQLNHTKALS
jgi:hypothetical protein